MSWSFSLCALWGIHGGMPTSCLFGTTSIAASIPGPSAVKIRLNVWFLFWYIQMDHWPLSLSVIGSLKNQFDRLQGVKAFTWKLKGNSQSSCVCWPSFPMSPKHQKNSLSSTTSRIPNEWKDAMEAFHLDFATRLIQIVFVISNWVPL